MVAFKRAQEENMTPNQMLQKYLMASYAYYIRFISVMEDSEYDRLARELKDDWDNVDHQHKHLVTKDDLNAGTLYALSSENYPLIIQSAAEMWIENIQKDKMAGE